MNGFLQKCMPGMFVAPLVSFLVTSGCDSWRSATRLGVVALTRVCVAEFPLTLPFVMPGTIMPVTPPFVMSGTVVERYAALAAAGDIERDPAQEAVVARLAHLSDRLAHHRLARKSSSLGWLFGSRASEALLKGLYIFGDVGRGKTMLMDMFFAPTPVVRKRRVHFHEFMLDVHECVHAWRQKRKRGEVDHDPIAPVTATLADQAWLLCFDEFHVTDIADAMILGRLFTQLFARGVVVVATSNVAPGELYQDGLNRGLFLPFIALLDERLDTMRLDARTDYRLEKLVDVPVWLAPADAAADRALDAAWQRLTGGRDGARRDLIIKGRVLSVPKAAMGVARFSFHDLCEQPLGANDYLKLAHEFHTLLLDHIAIMSYARRNEARRFIALIDTLYDNAVKLVASAEAEPAAIYQAREGFEAQEFRRTISRVAEMGSRSYLALPHGRRAAVASGSRKGIVET
jgi:cell division protein ZapE